MLRRTLEEADLLGEHEPPRSDGEIAGVVRSRGVSFLEE